MTAAPSLRHPRALVQVNGTTVQALLSLEIDQTPFSQPSTFRIELAVQALPPANDLAWWMKTMDEIDVEIFIGFPSDPTTYRLPLRHSSSWRRLGRSMNGIAAFGGSRYVERHQSQA